MVVSLPFLFVCRPPVPLGFPLFFYFCIFFARLVFMEQAGLDV